MLPWIIYFCITSLSPVSAIISSTVEFCKPSSSGSASWTYWSEPPSAKSATVCPCPVNTHLEVSNPSTPTGPRAWMRPVLIPTSAPTINKHAFKYLYIALFGYIRNSIKALSVLSAIIPSQVISQAFVRKVANLPRGVGLCTIPMGQY